MAGFFFVQTRQNSGSKKTQGFSKTQGFLRKTQGIFIKTQVSEFYRLSLPALFSTKLLILGSKIQLSGLDKQSVSINQEFYAETQGKSHKTQD